MRIQHGDTVVFLGDSITEHLVAVSDALETQSADLPPLGSQVQVERYEHRGWTELVAHHLQLAYPGRQIRFRNAGLAGHTSRQMRARLDVDVLAPPPQWLLLSAGVCEVRRRHRPDRASEIVSIDEYIANLTAIIERSLAVGAQVILLEPTPHIGPIVGASATVPEINAVTAEYVRAMRHVAASTGVGLVPLFDVLLHSAERLSREVSLYADEVHLNARGDLLYAQQVLSWLARP